ncbi:hypothetical protein LSM04_007202 [Trypanosoma melophagium]|uniref:uncharacterized protein n=1 Tax=Trypanosoma melophagium TaxID=715481 RepID=UPI00351A035E|nr:hypothetical protein LSM04_007202 [Trypanosoma melophagium]
MRSLRFHSFTTVIGLARLQSSGGNGRYPPREQQQQHHQRFGRPREGRTTRGGHSQPFSQGGPRNTLSEPQLVARLLELYPSGKSWLPVNKWASSIPEDIQEALVPYGGLAHFAVSQSNFFIVRKENGTSVVSLSTMASSLCAEREKNIKKRAEKAAAFFSRRQDDSRHHR